MPSGIYDQKKCWEVRRKNDPDNLAAKKAWMTRRKNGNDKNKCMGSEFSKKVWKKRYENGTDKSSNNTKQKLSISHIGNKNGVGKRSTEACKNIGLSKIGCFHTNETKRKLRLITLDNIEKFRGKLRCFIGKNETKLLNEQEIKDNCKIIRQYIISELGYIADGYCAETNIIYEVYEKKHEQKIEKDQKRQKEIEEYLGCKFIIILD